ncbi:MAG: transglycosylase domain-containing protein, partial [bacterium]
RTWIRKIKEIIFAFQLERKLSKEQILELYLNDLYFGRGIYGIQAACKRFWNKDVTQVTLDQAATLAAVAKSARYYSPLNAPLTAKFRRNVILKSMQNLGYISEQEQQEARKEQLVIQDCVQGSPIRMYIQEWIRTWAEQKWGRDALYHNGLKIKTTISARMQDDAEKAFSDVIQTIRTSQNQNVDGGMVTLEVTTGKIKTVVGGMNFYESQFNRAFQAYRQLGSSFKPILYALALTSGFDMDDVFVDEPFELQQPDGSFWKPRNWHRRFEGGMTLLRALTMSNNIISIKLLLQVGVQRVVQWAQAFGITRDLLPFPSLALGTAHASPQENAAAFNVFANNGMYVEPYMIEWVKDTWGKKIWTYEPVKRYVLDSKTNSKMVKALTYRMEFVRNFAYKEWIDCESIGKSGSTNGAVTTWFVGSTPEYTAAIYIGRDDSKPMGDNVYANSTAFPIWLNFFKTMKSKNKHFYYDPELKPVDVNWVTGKREYMRSDSNVVTILKN